MDSYCATFAALFLLFAAASCAPAPSLQDACEDVRSSSMNLNHKAKSALLKAQTEHKDLNFTTSLVWMEAKDTCDPKTLRQNSVPCIGKILDVLTSYTSAVEKLSGFQSCSEVVSTVKPAMQALHADMSKCVNSRTGTNHQRDISDEQIWSISRWQEPLLCHYIMDRLFSFSILTARVFAVGDPAHHADGSTQTCM